MDIHKPKPWRGWPEFVKEIGTIVIGVLIALVAEQAVERLEWAHKVRAAEDAMRVELLFDDGPQAYQRTQAHDCIVAKLDEIRAGVETGASRADMVRRIAGFKLDVFTYDTAAHEAATHAGVADHMLPARLGLWTTAYNVMPYMERANAAEAVALGRLRALRRTGGALSEAEDGRVLEAVEALRVQNRLMVSSASSSLPAMRRLGPLDAGRVAEMLGRARAWYGPSCVHDLRADWYVEGP
jgi:hypothetical protein